MDMMMMMLGADDGVNQSFSPPAASPGTHAPFASGATFLAAAAGAGPVVGAGVDVELHGLSTVDIEDFPMEELLKSEWLNRNISRMLNISVDNLTSLLTSMQHVPQPQRDSVALLITLTVFYALIFVAGVLGNLITCIVISRNKFMHTATNFYLFNLAVSDLILLLSGMPQDLYNIWNPSSYPFTDVLCVMESVLSETAANATVLTITAFTVERYIAICHPFRQHTMSKLSRAIKFIFAIWVMALLLALPQAMQFSVVAQDGGTSCTMQNDFFAHVFAVSGFIFFGGPMTAICVLYVLIGVKLKRSRLLQTVPRRCYDVQRGISAQTRVIRMLVAVAVAFFLCWAPFHAQRLMAVYGSTAGVDSQLFNEIFRVLNYTSGVLYFLSTCINPLLYNIMSHKFREAFKVTLTRHFGLAAKYQTQNHNYSAMLRQNGSMRLHTTDSIRTTTTTTTINSINSSAGSAGGGGAGGGGGSIIGHSNGGSSCRSAQRHRSGGAQATQLVGNHGHAARGGIREQPGPVHRALQSQISQLSSVGDANSLLESEGVSGGHYHPHPHPHPHPYPGSVGRFKELRHTLAAAHKAGSLRQPSDCASIASRDWADEDASLNARGQRQHSRPRCASDDEAELVTKPVAPPTAAHMVAATTAVAAQPIQPMNSIAELTLNQPTRSRLKLSRIISRRDEDAFALGQSSPRVELMRSAAINPCQVPLVASNKPPAAHKKVQPRRTSRPFDSLAEKFRRRPRRQSPSAQSDAAGAQVPADIAAAAASACNPTASPAVGTVTPATGLMRITYPATAVSRACDPSLESRLTDARRGANCGYRKPTVL